MKQQLINYINKTVSLSTEESEILISKIETQKYSKGDYIVKEGKICWYICFVLSGCTKNYYHDNEGDEKIVQFAIENWWTSDLGSFISQTSADLNIECMEDTEVIRFNHEKIEEIIAEVPQFERFLRINTEQALVAAQKRIIRLTNWTIKERYLLFRKQYPKIEQFVPQYMIASYLGVTKEFFSKMKKEVIAKL